MPDGSEFQTAGAATLKPREAKVVQTRAAADVISLISPSFVLKLVPTFPNIIIFFTFSNFIEL